MSDDADLYRRWTSSRDEAAFEVLARRNADLVADVAWRVARDRGRAEDALQEALLALARDGTDRPARVGVRAWLARAAISRAGHALRSDLRRARRERAAAHEEATVDRGSLDAGSIAREALSRADPEDAAILALRYLHGMDYAEIAVVLDVEEVTARVRAHRALDRVRARTAGALSESALEAAVASLPRFALDPSVVARVLTVVASGAAPLAGAAAATSAAAGTEVAAEVGGRSLVAWLLGGLAAALAIAGVFAAWPRSALDEPRAPGSAATPSSAPADESPRLAARPGSARERPAPDPETPSPAARAPGVIPSKGAPPIPAPAKSVAAPVPVAETEVAFRLDLVFPGTAPEEIAVSEVAYRGQAWSAGGVAGLRLKVRPNTVITLLTKDPRAAAQGVWLRIPDPVPPVLVGHLPAASDPRLASLAIEVVDATTGAPIPRASLLFQDDDARPVVEADAAGRIVLTPVGGATDGADLSRTWFRGAWSIDARGYYGESRSGPSAWDLSRKEFSPAAVLPEDGLREWLDRGAIRVPLAPLGEGWREREIRLVDAAGRPAAGLLAVPSACFPSALGAAATPHDVCPEGPRRVGLDGRFSFAVPTDQHVVALDVVRGGSPVAAYLLSVEDWPASGPREIRMPALAEVEVALEGVPADATIGYVADWLGAARTPQDGPAFPVTADPGVLTYLAGRHLVFYAGIGEIHGDLAPGETTLRFPMPVGTTKDLRLWGGGGESRLLTVEATAAGPLRLVRRWGELPPYPQDTHWRQRMEKGPREPRGKPQGR